MAELRIIPREEAGLVPPRYRNLIPTPTAELWLHHSAGALDAGGNGVWWDDVQGIQRFHMAPKSQGGKGWSDIAYSFLVGGGQVFEGRGAGVAGGHTAGDNSSSHAICLIGDYTWMVPKQEDLEAIAWLMRHGREQGWWDELTGPHRDAPGAQTTCCGTNLIACIPDLRHMASTPSPTPSPTPFPSLSPLDSEENTMVVALERSHWRMLITASDWCIATPSSTISNLHRTPDAVVPKAAWDDLKAHYEKNRRFLKLG